MRSPKLLTVAHLDQLLANGLAADAGNCPVVKFFSPDANATWLISEVDPDDPDRLFGLCDLGLGSPELGYVSLSELKAIRGPLGLAIERDRHFVADKLLSSYAEEARHKGRIIA